MAYPPAYVRAYSFTDFETLNPGEPKPGPQLDIEYDAVSNALTATQTNLALIQRADGELANESVGADQLEAGLFDAIGDAAVADAEAAAAAAAASASAAAGSASSASTSASAASASAGVASGAAAQAGVSQGIAQSAANEAALSAADSFDSAQVSANAGNEAQGFRNEAEGFTDLAFRWAELLTGPVLPAPPGWPEAVDDGMFSSKWWAIRARDFNSTATIDLGPGGEADIGEAFDNWDALAGNDLGLGQTFATWGTPPHTYILIDRDNPSDPASWTDITGGPGPAGPPNTLTIGAVTTGAVGQPAAATITGASPDQVLNLTLPTGATGPQGVIGPAGPPNILNIGTVTTVPDGTPAGAAISGTSPTQTLSLTIPAGPQGIQGIQGIQGPVGPAVNVANPTGLVGLTAVNGVATTAPRSDSSPALSQAIAPVWTGVHNFGTAASMQTNATIGARGRPNGFEFGHTNGAGYGSTLGHNVTNGRPFLAFNAEAGTTANTFRTRGVIGRIIQSDAAGGLLMGRAALANADDQSLTVDLTINAAGLVTIANSLQVNGDHIALANTDVYIETRDTDAGADEKVWWLRTSGGTWSLQTRADSLAAGMNALTVTRVGTAATQLMVGFDGTAALPAYSFFNDNDTGLYRVGTNNLGIAVGGALTLAVYAAGIQALQPVYVFDGSASAPTYSFTNDPDTGMYRVGSGIIDFASNGAIALRLAASGVFPFAPIYNVLGTAALPSYSFDGDSNTGMYLSTTDQLALSAGGFANFFVGTTAVYSQAPVHYFQDGSAATPGIAFYNDFDTGISRIGADDMRFSAGGITRFIVRTDALYARLPIHAVDGSAATPSFTFESDPNTGIYRVGPDYFGATVGGVFAGGWIAIGGVPMAVLVDGTAAAPGLAFDADRNTGIYRATADTIGVSTNGVVRLGISTVGASFTLPTEAPSFTSTSSRAIKRETGSPKKPANILARLRPLLYRLLDGDDREQLGLIAEEVHEVCPQLSDGKSVAYDRLAILLLAAWQDEHLEAA